MQWTAHDLAGTLTFAAGTLCASPASPGDRERTTARDSAGVTIVENQGAGESPWQVTSVLNVGQREGDERDIFGRIAG